MQKDDYNKYARKNVTKTYKRSKANRVKNINHKLKLSWILDFIFSDIFKEKGI